MCLGRSARAFGIAALLACALFATPAAAVPVPVWQPGVVVQLPSGGSGPWLSSVSCTAPGDCSAVGQFSSDNDTEGLLLNESSGSWATGVQAALPTPTSADPDATLSSVSCSSPGNCSAIGTYYDSNGIPQGLLLTETNGQWGNGVEATLPSGNEGVVLESVSCAAAGDCSAVGYYVNTSDVFYAVVIDESGGIWKPAQAASIPSGRAGLSSVSCWSPGDCTAVGYYADSTGSEGVEVTETNGQWGTGLETQPPSNVDPTGVGLPGHGGFAGHVELSSVSCTTTGDCSAAGTYYDTGGVLEAMVEDEVSGAWQQSAEVNLPSDAASPASGFPPPTRALLNSISCASPGNCAAVGHFISTAGQKPLAVSESSGAWSDGSQVTLPSGYGSTPEANLSSVSCPAAGECVAAGSYETTTSNNFAELFVSQDAGTWGSGVSPTLASGSTASDGDQSVSCSAPAVCGAADANGNLFSSNSSAAPPGTPTLALTAPSRAKVGKPSSPTATLSGGSSPTGTITFKVFGPRSAPPTSCTFGGATVGTATVTGNALYSPTPAFTPRRPGKYWWYATYSGDGDNDAANSDCGTSSSATTVTSSRPAKPGSLTVRGVRSFGDTVRFTLVCKGTRSQRCRAQVTLTAGQESGETTESLRGGQDQRAALTLAVRRRTHSVLTIRSNGKRVLRRRLILR